VSAVWHISGGRTIDPVAGTDEVRDLWIAEGRICDRLTGTATSGARSLDARGKVVVPGFIDLHVHFREPGNREGETVAAGSAAAAAGGFTSVVTMPNTNPAVDSAAGVVWQREEGRRCGKVRVLPSGCLTVGRRGRDVADIESMAWAGAVAFTDDGATVADDGVMRRAMAAAARQNLPVMDHALDPVLAGRGVMRLGDRSRRCGLEGIPPEAEVRIVVRDIRLARETGAKVHIQHLSAAGSVEELRRARAAGESVSAEATPHHITLCDEDVAPERADAYKMNPPLGSKEDREALLCAVADGSIGVLATDHAPHRAADKARGFGDAPFGVVGLETAIGVTYTALVKSGRMPVLEWVRRWTVGPAEVLGMPAPSLTHGAVADIAVLDLDSEWVVDPARFLSKGRNTPFAGRRLTGRSECTFLAGEMVH
jgi:dihydroorotase